MFESVDPSIYVKLLEGLRAWSCQDKGYAAQQFQVQALSQVNVRPSPGYTDMDDFGNSGVSAWFDPQLPDSEYLVLTSLNGQQLENSLGASLLRREEVGEIRGQRLSEGEGAFKDTGGVTPVVKSGGGAGSTSLNAQFNGIIPHQCYNSPENRSCFDEGYPFLFYNNKGDSGRFESCQGPFRIGSCYEPGPDVDRGDGDIDCREMQNLTEEQTFNGLDGRLPLLFERSCVEGYEVHEEGLEENGIEDGAGSAVIPNEHGIQKECLKENAREDPLCVAGSAEEYEILKECSNVNAGENRACDSASVKEYAAEVHSDAASVKEYEAGFHGESSNEKARDIQIWSADGMEEYDIHKEISIENTVDTQACNTDTLLSIPTKIGEDCEESETPIERICYGIAGNINPVFETSTGATMHHEDEPVRQQSPLESPSKPVFCKSSRRKKLGSSKKRVPRKKLTSQKRKDSVPVAESELVSTSEGLAVSTCAKIDVVAGSICSSSVVASTGPPNCSSNKVDLKYHAAPAADNTDCAVSVSSSNMNIASGTAGRVTRSRAPRRPCEIPVGCNSLMDKSNVFFANKTTGKRSVLCKTVRSTIWGGLEMLKQGLQKKGRALKSEVSSTHPETGKTDIEAQLPRSQKGRKKASRVRGGCRMRGSDDGQSERMETQVSGGRRNCTKRRNGNQGKGVMQEVGLMLGDQEINNQGGEFSCLVADFSTVEENSKNVITKEEYELLETKSDRFPVDQSMCHLSLEVSNLVAKVEEEDVSHRPTSEQATRASVNGPEYHIGATVKAEDSEKGPDENGQHGYMAHEKESNVRQEEEAAITVQAMCRISIDNRAKLLDEGVINQHAGVGIASKSEENGIKVEKGLVEACNVSISWRKLRNQKRSQHQRETTGFKNNTGETKMPSLEFPENTEMKSQYTGTATTEIHLTGLAELGMAVEALANPYTSEFTDKEFHDTVSVDPQADVARTVILPTIGQELGKKNGRRKGKIKGKSGSSRIDLGIAEVPGESLAIVQEQEATGKVRKSKYKETQENVSTQKRKSKLKGQKKLLHADDDQLIAIEAMPLGIEERKAIHEPHELCKGKERLTLVREEPVENAKLENTVSNGKSQEGKKSKNSRQVRKKSELTDNNAPCHGVKSKTVRQKNSTRGKKPPCSQSKGVQKGLQSMNMNNNQLGTVGCSPLSGNDSNFIAMTEEGKQVLRELPGLKNQSDLCALNTLISEAVLVDASSPSKTALCAVIGQQNHESSNFIQGFCENDFLKDKILESERIVGGNNEVVGEDVSSGVTEGEANKITRVPAQKCEETVEGHCGPPRVGWVSCDDCHKWRCIPVELADAIEETNCKWTCQDNPNKEFADCSIPQEKSNAEINAELNISEVSCEEGDCNGVKMDSKDLACMQTSDPQQGAWTLIKHNTFLHRSRKVQVIDEIMVCHCKSPDDGSLGCGDECLNRMLSIECVQGTCPCGELCSNQQFQKRLYVQVAWFRCGKKGFGLRVLEDVSKGVFITEYVGEVLDMQIYEARQREYASRGQKHFYFMTVNSNEVIDACVKGNLGRFINHSCDPNCRTEKWMVNGEVCIGLFAIRDIKKGEEVTFDYNYVRVVGAAAKKCECGSAECRGFIGGDPLTPSVVAQVESDEDYPAPVMLQEENENEGAQEKEELPTKVHSFSDDVAQGQLSFLPADLKSKCSPDSSEKQVRKMNARLSLGKSIHLKSSMVETSGGHFEGVEDKLNELLDGEGGISKRKDAAKHYLKLLLVTAAGDTVNGEASHSTRDLSMVLDALLKTRSRTVLIDIMNKNGLQMLHNMMKQNRWNYNKTPIIRKLLKVLDFLATKDVLTIDHINSGPPCKGMESFKESIFALTRHSDHQVQVIARCFRDNWIPRTIKMFKKRERLLSFQGGVSFNDCRKNRCKFSAKRRKCMNPRQTDAIDCTSQLPRDPEHIVQINSSGPDQCEASHSTWDICPNQDSSGKQNDDVPIEGEMKVIRKRKRKSRWDQPTEAVVDQYSAQMTSEGVESNMQLEKRSDSLNSHCQRDNILEREQDVHADADEKWTSEQKPVGTSPAKNIPNCASPLQSCTSSHLTSVHMSTLNGCESLVKQQPCLRFSMQQGAQVPVLAQSSIGSKHVPLSSMNSPVPPPCCPNTVYGYAVGKPQGNFLPHLPLSYGIPLPLLEQLGRPRNILQDCTAPALSPLRPHCELNNNLSSVRPDLPYQPCAGQASVGGFPQHLPHQLGAWNAPFPMQSAARPMLSRQQQAVEMHPVVPVVQGGSAIPDYVEPEPPVPGLSPPRSSDKPCNSNRSIKGRSKAAYDQTVKLGKRHWKQYRSNFKGFSKFHGRSDKKYKDWFHQKSSLSFKGTWKGRFSSNFHRDQNIHHVSSHDVLELRKEQQQLEHVNGANFSKSSSKNVLTFHHQ